MSEPQRLGVALDRFFGHMGAPPLRTVADLGDRWTDIVGPGLSSHSRPGGLIDGVLTVRCDDAAWLSQIRWMETQIKARFAECFPDTELRAVRASVDR